MSNNLLVSAIALPNALFSTRSVSVPKHLIEVPLFFWNISTIFIWKKIFTMGLSIPRFTNKLASRLYLDTNVWKWCYKSSVGQFLRKREPKRMITNFYHLWYSNIWYMLRTAFFARIVVVSWKWKHFSFVNLPLLFFRCGDFLSTFILEKEYVFRCLLVPSHSFRSLNNTDFHLLNVSCFAWIWLNRVWPVIFFNCRTV